MKKGGIPAVPVAVPSPEEFQPERDLTQERDNEVIPAALAILKAIANKPDLPMGARTEAQGLEVAKYYQKLYQEDIVPILLEHNLRLVDIPYLFQLVLQPVNFAKDLTDASLKMNEEIATAGLWGVAELADIRIKNLDAKLTEQGDAAEAGDNASATTDA